MTTLLFYSELINLLSTKPKKILLRYSRSRHPFHKTCMFSFFLFLFLLSVSASIQQIYAEPLTLDLPDGEYSIEVSMTGGSGKSSITSPSLMVIREGQAYARIQWSSSSYDYMIVDNSRYDNENQDGGYSTFLIPITCMDQDMEVTADTTAMGDPHEITYRFIFSSESIGSKSMLPQEAAKRVVAIALIIIVGGGILNHYTNKKRRV